MKGSNTSPGHLLELVTFHVEKQLPVAKRIAILSSTSTCLRVLHFVSWEGSRNMIPLWAPAQWQYKHTAYQKKLLISIHSDGLVAQHHQRTMSSYYTSCQPWLLTCNIKLWLSILLHCQPGTQNTTTHPLWDGRSNIWEIVSKENTDLN